MGGTVGTIFSPDPLHRRDLVRSPDESGDYPINTELLGEIPDSVSAKPRATSRSGNAQLPIGQQVTVTVLGPRIRRHRLGKVWKLSRTVRTSTRNAYVSANEILGKVVSCLRYPGLVDPNNISAWIGCHVVFHKITQSSTLSLVTRFWTTLPYFVREEVTGRA